MASCCAMVFTFLLELLIYLTVFFLFVSVSTRFIVFARRASPLVVPISLVVLHFARRLATVPYRLTLAAIFAFAFMPPLPRVCSAWPLTSRRPLGAPSASPPTGVMRAPTRAHLYLPLRGPTPCYQTPTRSPISRGCRVCSVGCRAPAFRCAMPGSVPLLSKNFYSHSLILWLCEVATLGVVG